jgi:hypothetical protein
MKSDISLPSAGHKGTPAGKSNHPIAEANAGTMQHPSKSHESDVQLGEGLNYNAVHPAHEKHSVREAKHVGSGVQQGERKRQEDMENGKASGCGE